MPYKGQINGGLVRDEEQYVHGQGITTAREHVGRKDVIDGLISQYVRDNWQVSVTNEQDGYYRLVATRGGSALNAETDHYDRFTLTKETLQKSIWTIPAVVAEATIINSAAGANTYQSEIQAAVESGDLSDLENALPVAQYPNAHMVFRELCRGADSYETEYIVLARERMVSYEFADTISIPQLNAALIYSTSAALRAAYDIPTFDGLIWPDEPTPPASTAADLQWGWRERRREINFLEGARVEVMQDWTYAEWSTNIYEVAP